MPTHPFARRLNLAPALIIFALFSYWPFIRSIWLSLHVTNATGEIVRFNGLNYYSRIFGLTGQTDLLQSILLTLKFALMVVPPAIAAGVIFSMLYDPALGITRGLEQLLLCCTRDSSGDALRMTPPE